METISVYLNESLSHSVRLAGAGEIRFVKGQPLVTSDQNIISYVKSRPTMFGITVLKAEEKPAPKQTVTAVVEDDDTPKQVVPSEPPPARRQPNLRRPGSRPKASSDDDA